MTEQLIDLTINTQVTIEDLSILAEMLNWKETVSSLVSEAVYEGETLITPAVYEEIPNPYTINMWLNDYIGGVIGDKINEARKKYAKKQRQVVDTAEEIQRHNRIKGNTSASIVPIGE